MGTDCPCDTVSYIKNITDKYSCQQILTHISKKSRKNRKFLHVDAKDRLIKVKRLERRLELWVFENYDSSPDFYSDCSRHRIFSTSQTGRTKVNSKTNFLISARMIFDSSLSYQVPKNRLWEATNIFVLKLFLTTSHNNIRDENHKKEDIGYLSI